MNFFLGLIVGLLFGQSQLRTYEKQRSLVDKWYTVLYYNSSSLEKIPREDWDQVAKLFEQAEQWYITHQEINFSKLLIDIRKNYKDKNYNFRKIK